MFEVVVALDLLSEIYSSFEPFRPALKEVYVDCQDVRGGWEVIRELGLKIRRSKQPTCQLYTGHRGVGKSTELLRLKDYLEEQKYFVVYFAADDEDIEPQDADYADIIFACTRHLVEAIKLKEHNPLLNWMKDRWESLKDIALTEVAFDGLSLEGQISQFAKITTNLRATPDKRRELRQKINANTPSLVEALNDFIQEAQNSLSADSQGIVLIVDNLDRMAETQEIGKPSNYDDIYLNRSEMLRRLACHVVYTVPIKMVYSGRATQLENNYDKPDVLPMIMIRNPDGTENKLGLDKMRELICRRIGLIEPNLLQTLEGKVDGLDFPPVFDNGETLKNLCLMSGGHVRNLMQLIQKAIDWTDELPITGKAAKRAIEETRETYQKTVQESEWETLARACHLKQAYNDDAHLDLLFKRCLLEYRYYDQNDNLQIWCNVHPLIEGIPRFQDVLAKVRAL
ncbi:MULTISPECIES: ATP-binding protein [unclassified Moorena]|uniref:ATP-binding protein n=1 Tax=unclassified Moorena TaxID=2683338 RepID=UPI0014018CF1|nr:MULTISPECIES: ATP-binding protein [unclassified Moorena]NEO11736.1 ATP-binding protein [Moorena sp. SIO3E8]NEP98249.1 ATP-binding protein [Moorena sp. SIO3F7]